MVGWSLQCFIPSFEEIGPPVPEWKVFDSIDQSKSTATMAVINDAQLSKDFDGLCLAKGILIFALSPAVIHSIAFSIVLSIYFAQKTIGI